MTQVPCPDHDTFVIDRIVDLVNQGFDLSYARAQAKIDWLILEQQYLDGINNAAKQGLFL